MTDITIQSADGGSFSAYLALPKQTPAPGLVLVQEIFGVNQVMRDLADSYAAEGFVVACPDLFWRIEPGVQLTDKTKEEWDRAFALMNQFLPDFEKGVGDIGATLSHLRTMSETTDKAGAVGYCLGGSLAYATACFTDTNASVGYYPVQIESSLDLAENIKNPLMLHLAEQDGFSSTEAQEKIKAALGPLPTVTIHTYPGVDHAFARKGGDNYDAEAANKADERTLSFLKSNLA